MPSASWPANSSKQSGNVIFAPQQVRLESAMAMTVNRIVSLIPVLVLALHSTVFCCVYIGSQYFSHLSRVIFSATFEKKYILEVGEVNSKGITGFRNLSKGGDSRAGLLRN